MNLDQQIQTLIDKAPQDGTTPQVVEAISPALKLLAEQLQHPEYYILQTLDQSWVIQPFINVDQPKLKKRVIYAFSTLEDALSYGNPDSGSQLVAIPLPVTHILFQMVVLEMPDSLYFFEIPKNFQSATEIKRSEIQELVQIYLQDYQQRRQSKSRKIPPNIA
ncbi:hypothetical protein PCC9214_00754 [Planktothrix tepida]|uniref:SseB protein N-terminal domain-containing protein n=2 Tax=Planktothrix TaxID=54304 RepID=A0A1J1LEQ1_9CYAN|nr:MULTISPECIES: hypothetical protein [Planktothrix]CAD5922524.1 hypothetical protein PCC9214_00754 [Planktothrix tepida]CAD5982578.1 hypothetical protein NO713_05022 [Planktothrix pseudagardhii]CUR31047.1 conserved hypothetical protein [Planktothrix tepida PCC 9214]